MAGYYEGRLSSIHGFIWVRILQTETRELVPHYSRTT